MKKPALVIMTAWDRAGNMYLFLSSANSIETYPNNHALDFTVTLPQPIDLTEGLWVCALLDIDMLADKTAVEEIRVYCDICQYSFVGDSFQPILHLANSFSPVMIPIDIPVRTKSVSQIRVYLKVITKPQSSFDPQSSRCTLRINRIQ